MPVATELRAVWDGMRPAYQAVLGGTLEPAAAAERMQTDAAGFIEVMHRRLEPSPLVPVVSAAAGLGLLALLVRQWPSFVALVRDLRRNPTAYLFAMPLADKLAFRSGQETDHKLLILEGVLALKRGENPRMIEETLNVFVAPKERLPSRVGRRDTGPAEDEA
jgi:hypothetical protein